MQFKIKFGDVSFHKKGLSIVKINFPILLNVCKSEPTFLEQNSLFEGIYKCQNINTSGKCDLEKCLCDTKDAP